MILVSACLLGLKTKYDGGANTVTKLEELCSCGKIIPVCPEQLGGLPTPRLPCEIVGGNGRDVLNGSARVLANDGTDVTANFITGARQVLQIAQLVRAKAALLKERSPSCGCHQISDGTFAGHKIAGSGVTTALLSEHMPVYSEEDLDNCQNLF